MPKFTKRHYAAIASVLRTELETTHSELVQGTILHLAEHLVDMFKEDNSAFQPGRFMRAVEAPLHRQRKEAAE